MSYEYDTDKSYVTIHEYLRTFDDLPAVIQYDLVSWFSSQPDEEDKCLLLNLYSSHRFKAWNCPAPYCSRRVYRAEPESWTHFQGCDNQDFTSYPGDLEKYTREYLNALCDQCRA